MVLYEYPLITYDSLGAWTLMRRILKSVGVACAAISSFPDQAKMVIEFAAALTTPQKTALDALMATGAAAFDPPTATGQSVFTLTDIYEDFATVKAAANAPNAEIWFRESSPGSGIYDDIEIQFGKTLSVQERKAVEGYYADNAVWTVL